MCDGCKISNDIIICHKLWSILWSIAQVWSVTIEYQVVQYVPNIYISEHFESILLTILSRISILLLWSGCHRCREWIPCRVVASSCWPTHDIVHHISWHDLPYRRTVKKYEDFPSMVFFQLLLWKSWVQTWFKNCQQYHCLFHIVLEYSPSVHDQGKMLALPNQLLRWVLSKSD